MATGKIVQIIGTVVDVEFPPGELPGIFNALEVDNQGERLVLEVEQHVGNNWVRCLSLGPTEGLSRGTEAEDTGSPVHIPVGPETLGRLFNVVGEPTVVRGKVTNKWQENDENFVELEMWSETPKGISVGPGPVIGTLPSKSV